MKVLKVLALVCLTAVCLFAQKVGVKREYLIAGDCDAARRVCLVIDGEDKATSINKLGENGWELVSAIVQGPRLVMIFKRPVN